MDKDGTNSGYDLELILMVKEQVTISVIEMVISDVKKHLQAEGIEIR